MTEEAWVAIIVALIGTGILTTMGKRIFDWITGKHKDEDNAWNQRDSQRNRADRLHEALRTHRTLCHKKHGMAYEDMPAFPDGG